MQGSDQLERLKLLHPGSIGNENIGYDRHEVHPIKLFLPGGPPFQNVFYGPFIRRISEIIPSGMLSEYNISII